jgi:nucleoside-diphosphate-sugar epimerase
MPTTLIYGGSGKVARHLTRLLSSATPPHTVHSVIRDPAQSDSIRALGGLPLVESIESSTVASMADTLRRLAPDAVVWSAGAGGGDPARTDAVDRRGAIRAMDACAAAGVRRFVIVSALDVRDRGLPAPSWYGPGDVAASERMWGAIGAYMAAKFDADRELCAGNEKRRLEYTIVRPGWLTLEPAAGTVAAGRVALGRGISREDVAAVLVECLANPGTVGLAFDVVGGETPVKDAVREIAEQKIDCFKGYY